jgi:hypothetical protein
MLATATRAPSLAAVALTIELLDRPFDGLGDRGIQRAEQVERAEEPEHGRHLHGLAALDALKRRATDAGVLGHLGLGSVAREAVARETTAQFRKGGVVGEELIEMHHF